MPAYRTMPARRARSRAKPRDAVFGRVQSDLLAMAESLAGVGYWRYSYADQALYWSDAVYEIYGLRRAEFTPTGGTAIDSFHPDDRDAARKAFNESIANGTNLYFERRLVRADGQVRWVISRAECQRNAAGEAIALIGVFQDVTERRRAEAVQQESTARLARIIELLPAGAVHVQDGVLSMNAAMEKVIGYSRDEITSLQSWFELLYGDTTGKLLARYRSQRANGFPPSVIGQIRRKDGESRQIEFRACNDSVGEIGIVEDITERMSIERETIAAKERAEEGARAKAEFLANMSHELRTPLTAIIGFAGLLTGGELPKQQRHWASRIEDASKALHSIVNDVLDFSKLEDGAVELDAEPFSLRKLVEDTVALVSDQAERKRIVLVAEISGAEACDRLSGDIGRLRQILLNLMSNAVKFTNQGAVGVRVSAQPAQGGAVSVRFEVTDTGIGIPEEAIRQLFQRFVQADGSISRRFGGTGLGLAISRRLVELMDGEIGVESRLGEGSTFWFRVVLDQAGEPGALAEDDVAVDCGALRVLLVEDAEPNQELVTTILESVGIEVSIACNGAEAVEAMRHARFDVVLMDVQMPVMGGVQATQIIRQMGGEPARTPVIALSANVMPDQVAAYRRAGMDAHLAKPINPREMLAAISHWAASGRANGVDGLQITA